MFARTPVAKEFRKWVLDVLDRIAAEQAQPASPTPPIQTISSGQKVIIQTIISTRTHNLPQEIKYRAKGEIWQKLHRYFQVAQIMDLPASQFDCACKYLMEVRLEHLDLPALPPAAEAPAVPDPLDAAALARGRTWFNAFEKLEKEVSSIKQSLHLVARPGARMVRLPLEKEILYESMNDCVNMVMCGLNQIQYALRTAYRIGANVSFV